MDSCVVNVKSRVKRTCFAPENMRKNSMFFRFRIVTEVLVNDCLMDQQLH